MSGQFEGNVALVTGGNSGIGCVTSMKFASEGAKVVIAARRVYEGEETVEMIRQAGGEAIFIKTDVTQADEVEEMVNKNVEAYGRLDYAYNNAGMLPAFALTLDVTEDIWDLMIGVNLKGVWLCMKYQIPQMLRKGSGAIVNASSASGLIASPGASTYSDARRSGRRTGFLDEEEMRLVGGGSELGSIGSVNLRLDQASPDHDVG